MKKFLISILIILLAILTYFVVLKNVSVAKWTSKSINNIKEANEKLDNQIDIAKQVKNQEYPQSISKLEDSIKALKLVKEQYEAKVNYATDDVEIGRVEIREYKIERLWIALENYAKKENIDLKLDLLDTSVAGVFDLDVTVVGEYMGITDFIYDIEKDDTLGFKIQNFKLIPNAQITNTRRK